jgi:hypothetical protein
MTPLSSTQAAEGIGGTGGHPEVLIRAPCNDCARMWLPRSWRSRRIAFGPDCDSYGAFKDAVRRCGVRMRDSSGRSWDGPYYPHPECKRHPPAGVPRHPRRLLRAYPQAPIKALYEITPPSSPLNVSVALIESCREGSDRPIVGMGIHRKRTTARLIAATEAVERHAWHLPSRAPLRWGTPREMARRYRVLRRDPEGEQGEWWYEVTHVDSAMTRVVPVEYLHRHNDSGHTVPVISTTGMAAHPSRSIAIGNGIDEVLERVGLQRWWDGLQSAQVIPNLGHPDITSVTHSLSALGYDLTLVATLWADCFVCCAAFVRRRSEGLEHPALVIGSGGAWDGVSAAVRAVREAFAKLLHALRVWPRMLSTDLPLNYLTFLHFLATENAESLWEELSVNGLPRIGFTDLETPRSRSAAAELVLNDVSVIDRGNPLTDYLGLHCIQALVPDCDPHRTPAPRGGLPYPF